MEIRVPDIGVIYVAVTEVHVSVGDQVDAEDPLITLESDKASMEVPAPVAGTVTELWVAVGDTVRTASPILLIEAEGGGDLM